MKNLTPIEQVAYQEGYHKAKENYKNNFKYGYYTGFAFAVITYIFCLTFNLYM
tara:strand:- start:1362 stop:1520 length:159 start_codon:yes stop_codon:yes gene_type:complete